MDILETQRLANNNQLKVKQLNKVFQLMIEVGKEVK